MAGYYIFGAHSRARTVKEYLRVLEPSLELQAYLIDNDEANPSFCDGVNVWDIRNSDIPSLDVTLPVYIGTRGVSHPQIIEALKSLGFSNIIPVTVSLDMDMRNRYVRSVMSSRGENFLKIDDISAGDDDHKDVSSKLSTSVYVVKSIFDKPLAAPLKLAEYEKYIQAGTALADHHIDNCECFDDTGENISTRNKQFCELTALYWIWKHAKEDIIGMVHYRRHFIFPYDWLVRFSKAGADVILPVPLFVAPNLAENYRERHVASNWTYMMDVLKERDEAEYKRASDFFENSGLYSPCNMFIMKREVLDGLCSWLFPVLFKVQQHGGILDDNYQNRYPGFLSERLITFYFNEHRDKYKVVYADKNFLQ